MTETGVMQPQAKDSQRTQEAGEARDGFFPRDPGGWSPLPTGCLVQ